MRLVCAAAVLSVTSSFTATFAPSAAARVRLRGSGDDDEAPSVDDADWRAFRAKLIAGGITTTTEETDAEEAVGSGDGGGGVGESGEAVQVTSGLGAGLDPANEALARAQSPSLSDLLTEPSWAHPIGAPEVGSLLLRLPLEVQLCVAKDSYWGRKLRDFAAAERTRAAMAEGREKGLAASEMQAGDRGGEDGAPDVDGDGATSSWNEVLLYRVATRFLRRELQRIAQKGTVDGQGRLLLDPRTLGDADKALLDMHQKYLLTWQEVVLVTKHDAGDSSDGVVINRPAATESTRELSAALAAALEPETDDVSTCDAEAFQRAFGPRLAAYVGKPQPKAAPAETGGDGDGASEDNAKRGDRPKQTAMIIHGLPGLEGAHELSPGLGIFKGGSADAARRVADEQCDPYDFRFFIGKHTWAAGELERDIKDGLYRPAACSRGVALKQCLGLPKPLWHEVMDMLGGTSAEISALEMARRATGN